MGHEALGHREEEAGVRQARIIVEEEQQFAGDEGYAGIAARWDTEVLHEAKGPDSVGDTDRLPAVADDDDVELDAILGEERCDAGGEFSGAPAHGEDNHRERGALDGASGRIVRHRSRLDDRIEARCPITVTTPNTRSPATSTRVATRSPAATSMTDATSASSVSSTEW